MVVHERQVAPPKDMTATRKIIIQKGQKKMKKAFKILIPLFVFALIVGCLFAFGASADATTGAESTDECWGVYGADGAERGKAKSLKDALTLAQDGDTVRPLFDNIRTDTVDSAELKNLKTVTLALKNNTITATGAELLFKIEAGSKLIINAENSTMDFAANKGLAYVGENNADLKAGLEINGLKITSSADGTLTQIIKLYGGDIKINNTNVLTESAFFVILNNESVVNLNMTNTTITQRAAAPGVYCLKFGEGASQKLAAGSSVSFTGCTFISAYRLFSFTDKDGQVPVTFDNCVLDTTNDTCIRTVGTKIEIKGESVVKAKKFVWCAGDVVATVTIGNGVKSATKTFYDGKAGGDSSPLNGFGTSLKYADKDMPYVYGGSGADDGSIVTSDPNGFNNKSKNGAVAVSSEKKNVPNPADGTKMWELLVNKGRFTFNPYLGLQNSVIKVKNNESFYLTLEFDVSTYDTIPERTQLYILGRETESGGGAFMNNAVVRMNNAGDGKFSVGFYVKEQLVGTPAIIDAGDWAHVSYVVRVTNQVIDGVNQSEGVVYVNGQFVGSSKGIFTTNANLASISDTRLEVASYIERETESSLLLANTRLVMIKSGGDFEETVFAAGNPFNSEYLTSDRPARIPAAQVGDTLYNSIDEALKNANGGTVKLLKSVATRLVINEPVTIDKNGYICDLYDSDVCRIITDDEKGTIQFVAATEATTVTYEVYGDPNAEGDVIATFTRPVGTLARIAEHMPLIPNVITTEDGKVKMFSGWVRNDNVAITDTARATLDEAENGVLITPTYTELTGAENATGVKVNADGTTELIADDAAFISAISKPTPSATYVLLKDVTCNTTAEDWAFTVDAELHLDLAGHALMLTGSTLSVNGIRIKSVSYVYSSLPGGKLISHYPVAQESFHSAADSTTMFTLYNYVGAKLYLGTSDKNHIEDENAYKGNLSVYAASVVSFNGDPNLRVTGFAAYINGVNLVRNGYNNPGFFQSQNSPVSSELHIANSNIIATSDIVNGTKPQIFAFSTDAEMTVTLKNCLVASGKNLIHNDESRTNTKSTITFEDCRIVGSLATTDETMRVILKGKNLLAEAPAANVEFEGVCGVTTDVADADKSLALTICYNTYSEWTETVDFNQPEQKKTFTFAYVTGHTYGEWTVTTPATCTENGEETRECSVCHEKETRPIGAPGHTWGEWTVKTPATCTADGTEERECSVCHEKETKTIKAPGHTWGEWEVTKAATCSEEGTKTRECSVCHVTETESIAKIAHTEGEWTVKTPATCEVDGEEHKLCTVCKEELETRVLPKLGHDMTDWVVTKEATCTEKGIKTKTCKHEGCTHKETEEIPMKAHTESGWIIDKKATESEEGTKHKECTVCHTKLGDSVAIAKIVASIDEEAKEWSKKSETLPTIKFNDSISDITEVKVNGETVDPKNYTVKSGELTFTKEYLETLKAGEYTVEAVSATGNANASFTVKGGANVALIVVLVVVGVIIVGGAVAFVIIKKKRA